MERHGLSADHRSAVAVLIALLCATLLGFAVTPVVADDDDGHRLKVMSRDLYLGADLLPVVIATDLNSIPGIASDVSSMVQATDFPTRAKALAAEIERNHPALIGLQEVSLWRRSASGDVNSPSTPADIVVYDFLDLLMDRLAAHGLHYEVAVRQSTFDAEVPAYAPEQGIAFDIRLTQRNVILARTDLPPSWLSLSNPQQSHFAANTPVPPFVDTRGWVSVDVKVKGQRFSFIDTHLDSYVPEVRIVQAQELLDGPADVRWPVVLVGDLNAEPWQPTIELLADGGFRDAWAMTRRAPGYTCCDDEDLRDPAPSLERRIDYVMPSRGIGVVRTERVGLNP